MPLLEPAGCSDARYLAWCGKSKKAGHDVCETLQMRYSSDKANAADIVSLRYIKQSWPDSVDLGTVEIECIVKARF